MVRNPHDVMVSNFFSITARKTNPRTFSNISDFIRHPHWGATGYKHKADDLLKVKNKLIIHYEDLFTPVWDKILSYFEIPIDEDKVKKINQCCSFSYIRKHPHKLRRLPEAWRYLPIKGGKARTHSDDSNAHKFRRGKVNGYMDYLSKEDIDYISKVWE